MPERAIGARVLTLARDLRRHHGRACTRGAVTVDRDAVVRESSSAVDAAAAAVAYLPALCSHAMFVERALLGQPGLDRACERARDEFAAHVALSDAAMRAHATARGGARDAHVAEVCIVASAELAVLAGHISEARPGCVAALAQALSECLATVVRTVDRDSPSFERAAVDWAGLAVALYAISTIAFDA